MEHIGSDGRRTVEAIDGVYLTQLAVGERMSIQHYRIEPGGAVPEHDHHHEQVGYIYSGTLTFLLADGTDLTVGAGDSFVLASGEPHAAENRGDEEVLGVDVFAPPRPDPDWRS